MITLGDRIALFADGLQAAQGDLVQCTSWDDVWEHAVGLSDETPVVSPIAYEQLQRGELPDDSEPLRSIADRSVGITVATLAVAETGSVLLIEPTPRDRAVSLLTRHLIVAVSEADIVEELADGFRWLAQQPRAAAYATFVTGPSRTADIERSLTIGVQGPCRMTVAVLA
ncbi:MAG: LUD domain-containing protein [Chloroflexota bacterium]|nr:LUD domain-containing protein [Chloroflexota bacterium]MDE2896405.1 LUD domain-containing protein [Chloroflexota bacterium]